MKKPLLPWSLLSAFGNTPLAKAVIITPVVAGYIYYARAYLLNDWGVQNAIWLYWSLIFLSIGQALYLFTAPREIKKHQDNFEAYVTTALATWSDSLFAHHALIFVSSFFLPHANGTLKISPTPEFNEQEFQSSMRPFRMPASGYDFHASDRWLLESVAHKKSLIPNVSARRINPDNLEKVLSALQKCKLTEEQKLDVRKLSNFLNRKHDSDEWKKDVLAHSFAMAERAKPISRYSTAFFYLMGSLYFLFHALRTAKEMVAVTLGF